MILNELNKENEYENKFITEEYIKSQINNFLKIIKLYKDKNIKDIDPEEDIFLEQISTIVNPNIFVKILTNLEELINDNNIISDIQNELIQNKNIKKKELIKKKIYVPTNANKESSNVVNSDFNVVFYLDEEDNFIGISEYGKYDNNFSMIRPIKNFFYKEKQFGLKFVLIMHFLKMQDSSIKTWKTGAQPVGGMKKYVFKNIHDNGFIDHNEWIINEEKLQNYINNL